MKFPFLYIIVNSYYQDLVSDSQSEIIVFATLKELKGW